MLVLKHLNHQKECSDFSFLVEDAKERKLNNKETFESRRRLLCRLCFYGSRKEIQWILNTVSNACQTLSERSEKMNKNVSDNIKVLKKKKTTRDIKERGWRKKKNFTDSCITCEFQCIDCLQTKGLQSLSVPSQFSAGLTSTEKESAFASIVSSWTSKES